MSIYYIEIWARLGLNIYFKIKSVNLKKDIIRYIMYIANHYSLVHHGPKNGPMADGASWNLFWR